MATRFNTLPDGTVASPKGFLAGATFAGIKTYGEGKLDLGVLYAQETCSIAGVFTISSTKGPSVVYNQLIVQTRGKARALVVNSGNSNTTTGPQGVRDVERTAEVAAHKLGILPEQVLVCSTGLIGVPLPMDKLLTGLKHIELSRDAGHDFARAIMTTDTHPKEIALGLQVDGKTVTVGGACKGAGMIYPNMRTMLCFVTTDAAVEQQYLQEVLREVVDASFNMVTVDGDMSPDDTVLVFANGLAGNHPIRAESPDARAFTAALLEVCTFLAKSIVRYAEGATTLIEVAVEGADTLEDARSAARCVADGLSVKTMVHGRDPNWGRIVAAVGQSSARVEESKIDVYIGDICVVHSGLGESFDREAAKRAMSDKEVSFRVNLNLGSARATAWGCDMSEEYVTLNSEYTT